MLLSGRDIATPFLWEELSSTMCHIDRVYTEKPVSCWLVFMFIYNVYVPRNLHVTSRATRPPVRRRKRPKNSDRFTAAQGYRQEFTSLCDVLNEQAQTCRLQVLSLSGLTQSVNFQVNIHWCLKLIQLNILEVHCSKSPSIWIHYIRTVIVFGITNKSISDREQQSTYNIPNKWEGKTGM